MTTKMRYFADKDGNYIGGNDVGITPIGADFATEAMPRSTEQKYDAIKDIWVDDYEQ